MAIDCIRRKLNKNIVIKFLKMVWNNQWSKFYGRQMKNNYPFDNSKYFLAAWDCEKRIYWLLTLQTLMV